MDQQTPNLYADSVQMSTTPFGVVMMFGMRPHAQTGTVPVIEVCNLRMSLEHAKVLAMMLKKQIKTFEDSMGEKIPLHPQIWQQMGLSKQEDW